MISTASLNSSSSLQLPEVTAVVVVYNQARYVRQCLEAVFAQEFPFQKVLIFDDASTDESTAVIRETLADLGDPDNVELVFSAKNRGLCANLNIALTRIDTPFFAYISGDDYMYPERSKLQMQTFVHAGDNCALVYADADRVDVNSEGFVEPFSEYYRWPDTPNQHGDVFVELLQKNWIPAPSVMLRTDAVRQVGGYDESLFYEDHDLWLRIASQFEISVVNERLVAHREHGLSLGAQEFQKDNPRFQLARAAILMKHVNDPRMPKRVLFDLWRIGRSLWAIGGYRKDALKYMRAGRQGISTLRYWVFYGAVKLGLPGWVYPRVGSGWRKTSQLKGAPESQVVLLTGLSGAGKTTIGRSVVRQGRKLPVLWKLLDGDDLRKTVSSDLGYSEEDRQEHLLRVASLAVEEAQNGCIVLVTMIAPAVAARDAFVSAITAAGIKCSQVYVATSLAVCEKRDVKGLYAQARSGEIANFTGISAPYDEPESPDLYLDTVGKSPEECAVEVIDLLGWSVR